jgi:hypothetical protein
MARRMFHKRDAEVALAPFAAALMAVGMTKFTTGASMIVGTKAEEMDRELSAIFV